MFLVLTGLLFAGVASFALDSRWHSPLVLVFLAFALSSVTALQLKQTLTLRSMLAVQEQVVLTRLDAIDEAVRVLAKDSRNNEIRLRQVGQLSREALEFARNQSALLEGLSKHEHDNESRLRQIGQQLKTVSETVDPVGSYIPLARRHQVVGKDAAGRLSAAVTSDVSRADKLLSALANGAAAGACGERSVGLIGGSDLQRLLSRRGDVCSYVPSMAIAQNKSFRPSTLVVEEGAMFDGPWAGALSASGIPLYDEMCQVIDWSATQGIPVYFVRNTGLTDIHTHDLAKRSFVISRESEFTEPWSEGVNFGFLEILKSYCVQHDGVAR